MMIGNIEIVGKGISLEVGELVEAGIRSICAVMQRQFNVDPMSLMPVFIEVASSHMVDGDRNATADFLVALEAARRSGDWTPETRTARLDAITQVMQGHVLATAKSEGAA